MPGRTERRQQCGVRGLGRGPPIRACSCSCNMRRRGDDAMVRRTIWLICRIMRRINRTKLQRLPIIFTVVASTPSGMASHQLGAEDLAM